MFSPSSVRAQQGGNTRGFVYNNANGSRFVQNADGSKFYDPGPSGVGRKWYESADGARTYIDDAPVNNSPSRPVKMEEREVKMSPSYGDHSPSARKPKSTPSKPRSRVKDEYDSDDTLPLHQARGTSTSLCMSANSTQTTSSRRRQSKLQRNPISQQRAPLRRRRRPVRLIKTNPSSPVSHRPQLSLQR